MLVPSYFHSVYRVLSPLVENIRSGCLPEQKLKLCKDAISYLVHHSLLQSLLQFIMSYRLWQCLGDNMKVLMWLQPTVGFFNFPYKDGASLFRFCNRYSWKLGRQAVGFVRLTMKFVKFVRVGYDSSWQKENCFLFNFNICLFAKFLYSINGYLRMTI